VLFVVKKTAPDTGLKKVHQTWPFFSSRPLRLRECALILKDLAKAWSDKPKAKAAQVFFSFCY